MKIASIFKSLYFLYDMTRESGSWEIHVIGYQCVAEKSRHGRHTALKDLLHPGAQMNRVWQANGKYEQHQPLCSDKAL